MSDMAEKRAHKRWTEKEIEFLKNNIGVLSFIGIAKKLNRTKTACIIKANKLKLGSYKSNTDKITASDAAEILNTNRNVVRKYINKGLLKAYRKCVRNNRYIYFLDIDEVEIFAKTHVKRNTRSWTAIEESKLKMYLQAGLTHKKIANNLGRTYESVSHKVGAMKRKGLL